MTFTEYLAEIDAELEKRDMPTREALDYTDNQWREMYKYDQAEGLLPEDAVDGIIQELRNWHDLNRRAPLRW
jgi:hypothetical protein